MPWCEGCDRFLSPSTVTIDGTCPRCGRVVDPGRGHAPSAEPAPEPARGATTPAEPDVGSSDDALPPIPWHLKLLAGAIAVYLGWRAYQGIEWLVHHI